MTTHKVSEYIRLKDLRLNTTFRRKNGKNEYRMFGRWVNQAFFDKFRPMPEYKKYNEKGICIGNLLKD